MDLKEGKKEQRDTTQMALLMRVQGQALTPAWIKARLCSNTQNISYTHLLCGTGTRNQLQSDLLEVEHSVMPVNDSSLCEPSLSRTLTPDSP
jgi:hypothetical protein